MANSYSSLFVHIVFSTKERRRLIKPEIESEVWKYLGGIARKRDAIPVEIGGIEDHVHILLITRPNVLLSELVQALKGASSRWISKRFPELKAFRWQDGYAVFTVSRSAKTRVADYISRQRIHHSKRGFEDEYLELLKLHDVDIIDEKYVFG